MGTKAGTTSVGTKTLSPKPQKLVLKTRVRCGELGHLQRWSIGNRPELVRCVAQLAAGYFLAVEDALRRRRGIPPEATGSTAIKAAIRRLGPPPSDARRYHRDGWVFQLIAWAAQVDSLSNLDHVQAPHPRPAMHGIDSLVLRRTADNKIHYVIIGEQKATTSPRPTVRKEVWPEFKKYEKGRFDTQLVNQAQVLLIELGRETAIKAAKNVHWNNARRYRVSVTAPTSARFSKVFAGYKKTVPGDSSRRRADIFSHDDVRTWFDEFCRSVVTELKSLRAKYR